MQEQTDIDAFVADYKRIFDEISKVIVGQQPVIRSDGTFIRDYFYVKDGAAVYLHLAERIHVREDAVELRDELGNLAFGHGETRKRGHVAYVIGSDRHYSKPRSNCACASTKRLRPISVSSKSTVSFASRALPESSATVPDPKRA